MAFQNVLFNTALDAMAADITQVSLHSTDGGTTGADELTGGAYARQTPAWGAAANASVATTAPMTFSVPGGSTVAFVGLWDAGDVWQGSIALANPEEFAGDGEFTVTSVTITAANAA